MRAGLGEAGEVGVGLVGVVDRAGDDDRRGAVLEQVDLLLEPALLHVRVGEQVLDRPGDAVALGLAGDHDRVVLEQPLDQRLVAPAERLALEIVLDLGAEHRVVLGQGVVALRLEVERRVAHDRVEEERLLERGDERVADPAQHRVEGPDRQVVLAALLERPRVVAKVLLGVVGIEPETGRGERVDPPAPRLDVLSGHERERLRVPSLAVDQQRAVEDLERLVRVERGHDLRERAEVAVDELADAARVVERPGPRAPGDEELEARRAERVLHVDDDEGDPEAVVRRRLDRLLGAPALGVLESRRVVDAPDLADAIGVPVRRESEAPE